MSSELFQIAEAAKKIITWPDWEPDKQLIDILLSENSHGKLTQERITYHIRHAEKIYPALYFLVFSGIVEPDCFYEVFVPLFIIDNDPLDPFFISYLVKILLEWNFFTKAQARHFINALIENSDIEEIYQTNKIIQETAAFPEAFIDNCPDDDYTLRTDFGDNDEEKKPKESFRIIERPSREQAEQAQVNMSYGGSDTFFHKVDTHLWGMW